MRKLDLRRRRVARRHRERSEAEGRREATTRSSLKRSGQRQDCFGLTASQ